MRKLIVIFGPTASGKTDISITVAKYLNTEVISADSRAIYKYLDIGTAKPPRDEKGKDYKVSGIRHHMLDFLDPNLSYDASKYFKDSKEIIKGLLSKGKIPVVVGGTGLYIDFLTGRRVAVRENIDMDLRKKLNALDRKELQEMAKDINEVAFLKMNESDKKNPRRLIRLIEKSLSGIHIGTKIEKEKYDVTYLMPEFDKESLFKKIDHRVDKMLENGWIDEVKSILDMGYRSDCPGLRVMGYEEIVKMIKGLLDEETVRFLIKKRHRAYAKRQITWFKKYENVISVNQQTVIDVANLSDIRAN